MAAERMARLRRLRAIQADLARRDLASCLTGEAEWLARLLAAEAAVPVEGAIGGCDPADPLHGAFASWLPMAAEARQAALAGVREAREAVAGAREGVAQARAALEACDTVLARAREEVRAETMKREQVAMEEGRRGR